MDFKEIQRTDKNLFICPFCFKTFIALAYHTRQVHDINAKQLRKMFGLKNNYQLITHDLKQRHRQIAFDNKEGEKLKLVGQATRYKQGSGGHVKRDWSKQALYQLAHKHEKKRDDERCM